MSPSGRRSLLRAATAAAVVAVAAAAAGGAPTEPHVYKMYDRVTLFASKVCVCARACVCVRVCLCRMVFEARGARARARAGLRECARVRFHCVCFMLNLLVRVPGVLVCARAVRLVVCVYVCAGARVRKWSSGGLFYGALYSCVCVRGFCEYLLGVSRGALLLGGPIR